MRQASLVGPRQFVLQERPVPACGAGTVLIRVHYCGVCMGEVNVWGSDLGTRYPLWIGHEVAGVVARVGRGVSRFQPGDRVAAITGGNGYADFVCAEETEVVGLPERMAMSSAMGEPLACAVNAVGRSQIALGDTVVIVGAGFMGLLALQAALLRGPAQVLMVDVRPSLRPIALELGASRFLTPAEAPEAVAETTGGDLADVVIEATGKGPGLDLAGDLVRIRGTLVIYGYHQDGTRAVNVGQWNWKGLDVINAHERETARYVDGMRRGLALVAAGRITLDPLITHVFAPEELNAAFALAEGRPEGFIKAVTRWAEDRATAEEARTHAGV